MKKRILILDDSCEVCSWLVKFIERKGKAHATQATSVSEANEILRAESFNLIFCDISMPQQDGDDFLLAHQEMIGDAQIVMISANSEERLEEAQSKLKEVGFKRVSYIQKPLVLSELFEIISS